MGQPTGNETLITGGAGFIGTNLAASYISDGRPVHVFDNLSRAGVEANLHSLKARFNQGLRFTNADVSDAEAVGNAVREAATVIHLAAQVAVTTSLTDPHADLKTNLLGTINLLEALRKENRQIPLLFTSTNKVYGKLQGIELYLRKDQWIPADDSLAEAGVDERQPLDFLSPYGCSKGSADQYVLDYSRSFGIPAVVFRMSCIYGPRQLGTEDQGWVAHFLRQAVRGEEITVFGDGKQVRDLLFVDDLVSGMRRALDNMTAAKGEAFNVGGGSENATSLLGIVSEIERLTGERVRIRYAPERLGDQRWYVANSSKLEHYTGWRPRTAIRSGLQQLLEWLQLALPQEARAEVQVA